jgi:hypothetical protein
LESETDSVMEKESIEKNDPIAVIDSSNFIPHIKNNWLILTIDQTFNIYSVKIEDGIKYIRRFYKTIKEAKEQSLYAIEPESIDLEAIEMETIDLTEAFKINRIGL